MVVAAKSCFMKYLWQIGISVSRNVSSALKTAGANVIKQKKNSNEEWYAGSESFECVSRALSPIKDSNYTRGCNSVSLSWENHGCYCIAAPSNKVLSSGDISLFIVSRIALYSFIVWYKWFGSKKYMQKYL